MKTLLRTAAVLAALTMPAYAFDPVPFSLTYPVQSRPKAPKTPTGNSQTHIQKDFFASGANAEHRAKPAREQESAQGKRHAR